MESWPSCLKACTIPMSTASYSNSIFRGVQLPAVPATWPPTGTANFCFFYPISIPHPNGQCSHPYRLIKSDPTSAFSKPTYAAAIALMNNFQRNVTIEETLTDLQLAEQTAFIDAVMETTVMKALHEFLISKGMLPVLDDKSVDNRLTRSSHRRGQC